MSTNKAVTIAPPRLPYHPALEERYGIDQGQWRALVEAIFPTAKTAEGVILALTYCKARRLDPFKRPVHIVPIYSAEKKGQVESVWPGIGELRTTAFRTGSYAGCDRTEFGPDMTKVFKAEDGGNVSVTFPEWAAITVYRLVAGQRVAVPGPRVYWLESYATRKRFSDVPNEMWARRPRGQLEKCAEAAALRKAFPEEIGGDLTVDEAPAAMVIEGEAVAPSAAAPSRPQIEEASRAPAALPEPGLNDDLAAAEAMLEDAPPSAWEPWELWRDQTLLNLKNAPTVGHVNKALKAAAEDFEDAPPEMVSAIEEAAEVRLAELQKGPKQ